MASLQSVHSVYQSVVEDVINGVREAFLDEGMDEQVLQELKQLWDSKLMQSKAIDATSASNPQAVAQASSSQQNFAPYHPGMMRVATQQKTIPVPHSNSVAQSMSENPPLAHQNSHIQSHPLNLQSGHPAPTITGSMSSAAQTAMLSIQNQMGRGTLPPGQFQLPNGQVLQVLSHPGGQNLPAGSFVLTSRTDQKTTDSSQPGLVQLDGVGDSSSDDDDVDDDEDDDDDVNDDNEEAAGEEEEPLNSGDDVSDADPTEVFDAENVVVCQFDKINRSKNRWKFHLKDGIMNLNGKDYVFQKAVGDAEW